MDTLLEKLLSTGSPLVVLVVVVALFLRYLTAARKDDREQNQTLHEQHLEARKDMRDALIENAANTKENTKALQSLELTVGRLKRE